MSSELPDAAYRRLFEISLDAMVLADDNGRYVGANDAACHLFGMERDVLLGLHVDDVLVESDVTWEAFAGHRALRGRATIRRGDGGTLAVEWAAVRDVAPGIHLSALRDITGRESVERALRTKEHDYDDLVTSTSDVIFRIDLDYRILAANPALSRLTGIPAQELIGIDVLSLYAEADRATGIEGRRRKEVGEARTRYEVDILHVSGAARRVELESWLISEGGAPFAVQFVGRDVTEARRREQDTASNEQHIREIVDAATVSLWLWDGETVGFANLELERMSGYPRARFLEAGFFESIVHPGDLRKLRTYLADRLEEADDQVTHLEIRIVAANGEVRRLDVQGTRLETDGHRSLLVSARDITGQKAAEDERRAIEEQLRHTQKLESLGVMAGGIAHDFNNLLVTILGNSSLLQLDLPADSSLRPMLSAIETAAERAADLTHQMLAYSGRGAFVVGTLDLSVLVREMVDLLRISVTKKVRLDCTLAPNLPPVMADGTQIRQVVMNLVSNAAEAIGDRVGEIAVRTRLTTLADERAHLHALSSADLAEGEYVVLEVRDTGSGMDEATLARIFEPFYTTKFTGRGLGLAAVLGIVRGHGGALTVDSFPGQGSTFRVILPAAPSQSSPTPADAGSGLPVVSGNPLVLVVDDEHNVRAVVRAVLERMGVESILAEDGWQAVRIIEDRGAQIAAVVLDLTMPGLDGEATLEGIHAIVPGLPIVLMSGYNDADRRFDGMGLSGYVQKPFTSIELAVQVAAAVTGRSGRT